MKVQSLLLSLCCLLMVACGSKTETTTTATDGSDASGKTSEAVETAPQGRYKAGDVLYCYAPSGLVLRDKPEQTGAKVASVPVNGNVEIKDENPFKNPFSVKEPCGMEIKGFWVKAMVDGKEGYMFDGYLLNLKPLGMDETVEDQWTAISKVKTSTDKAPKNDVNYYAYSKTVWENGVSYENSGYEGGSNSVLVLPKGMFTFQEAYLLTIANLGMDPENPFSVSCDVAKQTASCNSKDELAATDLEVDADGNFVITDSYAD